MARADAPIFWEECEQDATVQLQVDQIDAFNQWTKDHPHGIIMMRPGRMYVCDTHEKLVDEIITSGM
jgi:hypothetical protein